VDSSVKLGVLAGSWIILRSLSVLLVFVRSEIMGTEWMKEIRRGRRMATEQTNGGLHRGQMSVCIALTDFDDEDEVRRKVMERI
jgi:hypothetical protein